MAVKPEKIKERLKALFPKANLSTKRLDAIAAKLATKPADDADDAAIDEVLNAANNDSVMTFEEIAREDDRVRTLEANQKKPTDPPTPPAPPTDPPTPPTDDAPAWAKDLIECNKKLTQDLEAIKTGKIIETKRQTALQSIQASEVMKHLKPELQAKWAERINLESETSIEDQVKEIETEFTDLRQSFADSGDYSGPAPRGNADTKFSAEVAEKLVDDIL